MIRIITKCCKYFLIGLLLFSFHSLSAQTVKTVDFEYKEKGQWYKGSFDYRVETRQSNDILKNGVADFSGIEDQTVRQIYLRIGNFKVAEPDHNKVKIYFDRRWRSSTITLNELGTSKKTISLLPNRYKNLIYTAEENGQTAINLGFSYLKKTNDPTILKIDFTIKGIGEQEEEKTTDIAENTEPSKEEIEESAWEKTKETGTKEAYYDFLQKYPDSKYSSEATKLFERDIEKPTIEETRPERTEEQIETDELKTEEETAWEKALRKNSREGYEQFILAYPKSDLVATAKRKIELLAPIEVRISQEGNKYSVTFLNAVKPEITKVLPSREGLVMQMLDDIAEIVIQDKRKYTFNVRAKGGKTTSFEIDNAIQPLKGSVHTEAKTLKYKAQGGVPPYSLSITDENDIVVVRVNLSDSVGKITFKKIGKELNGIYKIDLLDSRKTIPVTFSGIEIKQGGQGLGKVGLFLGLAVGISILFVVVRHFYSKIHADDEEDFDMEEEDYFLTEETEETEEIPTNDEGEEES